VTAILVSTALATNTSSVLTLVSFGCSKTCHIRTFGTRDLRHANLPHRDDASPPPFPTSSLGSADESPVNTPTGSATPVRTPLPTPFTHNRAYGSADLASRSPVRAQFTGTGGSTPLLRANSMLPARFGRPPTPPPESIGSETEERSQEAAVDIDEGVEPSSVILEANMARTERGGDFQFPPTVPVGSSKSTSGAPSIPGELNNVLPLERPASPLKLNSNGLTMPGNLSPLKQTSTGTRYGMALGGVGTSPGKSWGLGGATPACPRCGKNVYFAEQVGGLPVYTASKLYFCRRSRQLGRCGIGDACVVHLATHS